jgi:hypothetical protein
VRRAAPTRTYSPQPNPPHESANPRREFGVRGQAKRDTALAPAAAWTSQAKAPSPLRSAGALHKRADAARFRGTVREQRSGRSLPVRWGAGAATAHFPRFLNSTAVPPCIRAINSRVGALTSRQQSGPAACCFPRWRGRRPRSSSSRCSRSSPGRRGQPAIARCRRGCSRTCRCPDQSH